MIDKVTRDELVAKLRRGEVLTAEERELADADGGEVWRLAMQAPEAGPAPEGVHAEAEQLLAEMSTADRPVDVAVAKLELLVDLWSAPDTYVAEIVRIKGLCSGSLKILENAIKSARTKRLAAEKGFKLADPSEPAVTVLQILRHGPVPQISDRAVAPQGWILSPTGVAKVVQRKEGPAVLKVAPAPIVVSGVLRDLLTGSVALRVEWLQGDAWRSVIRPRHVFKTARLIVELAAEGFPVDSNTSSDVVAYLSDYEAANAPVLEEAETASQLGWQGRDGEKGFMLGDRHVTGELESSWISFCGDDAGDDHLAACFRRAGSLEGWREAIAPVCAYPRVELALYASLVPPLLLPLGVPNFCVDWSGETSRGKTSTLLIAASAWGVPDERDHHSLVRSWNATPVSIERTAAALNGLPFFLDETKQAQRGRDGRSVVPGVIYAITNGQGKGRGTRTGLDRVRYWRTVLLTTGEQSAVDHSRDAGTAARTITLWGDPFEGPCEQLPTILAGLRAHHGIAGAVWVDWVVRNMTTRAQREPHRARLAELEEYWAGRLTQDGNAGGVSARLARYLAAIDLAGELATEVLRLPWKYESVVERCFTVVMEGAAVADRATEALREVYARCIAAQTTFYGRHNELRPPAAYAGRWDEGERWEFIAVSPEFLRIALVGAGFDFFATVRTWKDRNWIKSGDGKNLTTTQRVGSARGRFYTIRREAIEKVSSDEKSGQPGQVGSLFKETVQ